MRRIIKLFRFEGTSGVIMLIAICLALIAANSAILPYYELVHDAQIHFRVGTLVIEGPLVFWINEGLMVFFFLLVGLEIKRQFVEGHLARPKSAALPAFAAIGGMAVPALIYLLINLHDEIAIRGWAIPMATDIVLALGILSLLGDRVPIGLRIFLTAFATFDDIGAVVVIGVFYGDEINLPVLALFGVASTGLFLLNRFGIRSVGLYWGIGITLWIAMLESGLTASLAGIVIAFAIPLRAADCACSSPLREVERRLHPWVVLLVVPIFAFFNSGISLGALPAPNLFGGTVSGIVFGLFIGKQIGVFTACWLAVKLKLAELPYEISWAQIYGASILGGIGFTMSLFVATLAFEDGPNVTLAKLAILTASLLSAVVGLTIIYFSSSSKFPGQTRR